MIKQNLIELIEWLNQECPHGTMTNDLSYDFADQLRAKLDAIKLMSQTEGQSIMGDLPFIKEQKKPECPRCGGTDGVTGHCNECHDKR